MFVLICYRYLFNIANSLSGFSFLLKDTWAAPEIKPLIFWLQDGLSHHESILPLPVLFPLSILHPFPYISALLRVTSQWIICAPESRCLAKTFWKATLQNNAQQSSHLVTKGTFPRRLPRHDRSANAECRVTSGSPWLGGKLACWHWG